MALSPTLDVLAGLTLLAGAISAAFIRAAASDRRLRWLRRRAPMHARDRAWFADEG